MTISRSATIASVSVTMTGRLALEVDLPHRVFVEHLGPLAAMRPGQLDLEGHGPGGGEHAGVGLEDDVVSRGHGEARVGPVPLGARHPPVGDSDLLEAGGDLGHVVDARPG